VRGYIKKLELFTMKNEKTTNWYLRFDCSDWFMSTITMSPAERGIHINLLAWSFLNGAIPNDHTTAAITGGDTATIQAVLSTRWVLTNGGWINKRLESERQRCLERSGSARQSAGRRWTPEPMPTQCDRNANASPDAMPTQCDGNASQSQSHSQSQSKSQNKEKDILPFLNKKTTGKYTRPTESNF